MFGIVTDNSGEVNTASTLRRWSRELNYMMNYLMQIPANSLTFVEQGTAPGTPATGQVVVYASTNGRLYSKDDAGSVSGPL